MAKPVDATGAYSSKKRKAFFSGKIFLSYWKNDLSDGFEPRCKTLIVEDNVTFRQMLKESLCLRFPTMEIEEEPDERDVFNKIDSFPPRLSSWPQSPD